MPKPPNKPLGGSDSPTQKTFVSRTPKSGVFVPRELRDSVKRFADGVREKHGLLDRKVARKVCRRLEYLITPRPRIGRPPEARITKAVEMYERQRSACNGRRVDWQRIAQECIRNYDTFRSLYRRRAELRRLQSAVYARLGRRDADKSDKDCKAK